MLKVLGSMMLLCGCAGIGLLQVKQMDKRIRTLRSLVCGLEVMERELSFRLPLLEEMLTAAARSTEEPIRTFLLSCRDELNNNLNKPFCEIWSQAAHDHLSALKKSDLEHVLTLGNVLGKYDAEGMRQAIVRAQSALEQECSNAAAERCSQGKLYRVLSTTVGVLLVILLL